MEKCCITFLPWKKKVSVEPGTDLLSAAVTAGIHIYNSCGGEGVCGRCRVIIRKGEMNTEPSGRLSEEERQAGYVLACRTTCKGMMEVEVPPESRIEHVSVLTEETKAKRLSGLYTPVEEVQKQPVSIGEAVYDHNPLSTKIYLELPPPTIRDNTSDLQRLYRGIRQWHDLKIVQIGLANVRKLGKLLRDSDWKVTVTLGNRNETWEVVLVEPGNTTDKNYGVALDIGTSTIVAYLLDLNRRELLGAKASFNPQIDFGEDVITRIIFAREENGLEKLHHVIVDTINDLIQALTREKEISLNNVQCVVCAGNTTMVHLLLKIPPDFIREQPYIPTANDMPVIRAAEAGIKINHRGLLSCIPGIASYVGGDISAGVLASGMCDFSTLSMLIDLGTNGEVVLGNREWLIACSTSAGPCFEGGGIKWGIRAMNGAIDSISVDNKNDKVKFSTIGNTKPRGICGAGLIQAAGELLEKNIIDRAGRFIPGSTGRIKKTDDGQEFIIAGAHETDSVRDIVITEADIKNLMNSKGAIFSGCEVLLKSVGLNFDNLNKIFIAGGLGNSLDIEKAISIGLFPDLPLEKFVFIGNSAISGAKMCLLSGEAMSKTKEIADKMAYIELSVYHEFMNNYTASLFFPHTNIELFPTVKKKLAKNKGGK